MSCAQPNSATSSATSATTARNGTVARNQTAQPTGCVYRTPSGCGCVCMKNIHTQPNRKAMAGKVKGAEVCTEDRSPPAIHGSSPVLTAMRRLPPRKNASYFLPIGFLPLIKSKGYQFWSLKWLLNKIKGLSILGALKMPRFKRDEMAKILGLAEVDLIQAEAEGMPVERDAVSGETLYESAPVVWFWIGRAVRQARVKALKP